MLCIPLDYLNGWLFGVNASRVKADVREKLIAYQRDCYRVLARHFTAVSTFSSTGSTLAQAQVRAMGLAIAQMAEEQMTTLPTKSGELLVTPQPTPRLSHKRSVRA